MYIKRSIIKKMLKDAGAERVSDEATSLLHTKLNRMLYSVAVKTVKLTKHAKRKTVAESDARLATNIQQIG